MCAKKDIQMILKWQYDGRVSKDAVTKERERERRAHCHQSRAMRARLPHGKWASDAKSEDWRLST